MTRLSRRDWLRLTTAGVIGGSMSGWIEALAADTAANPQRRRACILLWMTGGPTQMDTFDLKPGHDNGGPYQEIATAAPGVRISEHLPGLAKHADRMAIIRSMSTKEGDHGRGTFLMRTGYLQGGPIQYPSMGALIAKELGRDDAALPNFVSIAPNRRGGSSAFGAGFLGPQYAPLVVGDGAPAGARQAGNPDDALKVRDLQPAPEVGRAHTDARIALLQGMERDFLRHHPEVAARSHQTAYGRAVRLMQTDAAKAFNLEEEKDALRDAYGRNLFGQGCLLARRLVERGVPFVEVALGGWDTHSQNFERVKRLSGTLDPAWAALMTDLKDRSLLDTTLIVWMGEFGRTPKINRGQGRDHFPAAWSTVLAGGGIKGGQVVGKTSADGMAVEERPMSAADLMSTVCRALGIDPTKQNNSNLGRPIRIVDKGAQPIREILADG